MPKLTLTSGLAALRRKDYKTLHAQAMADLKVNINNPLPYFLLAVLAADHGNHQKALELFAMAIKIDANIAEFHIYRASTLSVLRQQNAAKASADRAVKLNISDPFLQDMLGVIYSRVGAHQAAIPLFKAATSARPQQANFHYNLAASAQFLGDFETAKAAYKSAVALDPQHYRAWSSLVSLGKQSAEDNHLDRLIELFEKLKLLGQDAANARLQLGHAIAKTLEDLGRYEESLSWLIKGKEMKRAQLRYDRGAGAATFSAAKDTSANDASNVKPVDRAAQSQQPTPIFIVGLPRTGTTLVDRILSSHSKVISAGELNVFSQLIKTGAGSSQSNFVLDAETLLAAPHLNLPAIGQAYLEDVITRTPEAAVTHKTETSRNEIKYIVDKMPLNFFYAGLIHHALPDARIIVLRRGAMDSCLSNYRQLFSTQQSYYNYTYDLEDTAWFYREFDALMTHWQATLPADRFMEIQYEDIVFYQDNQTRKLLDFCGLGWEEACLRFHENKAPVSTASSVQVRQPLYSSSIGRWKKYGDTLESLQLALGPQATTL